VSPSEPNFYSVAPGRLESSRGGCPSVQRCLARVVFNPLCTAPPGRAAAETGGRPGCHHALPVSRQSSPVRVSLCRCVGCALCEDLPALRAPNRTPHPSRCALPAARCLLISRGRCAAPRATNFLPICSRISSPTSCASAMAVSGGRGTSVSLG
jgi:hypothetical protein